MAGFRARAADPIDLQVVPFPAVTVFVDLGGALVIEDEAAGAQHCGSLVVGPPSWSASTTPPTASPPTSVPRPWWPSPATPTSPTSTATPWPSSA
jgi:hypothetical protein